MTANYHDREKAYRDADGLNQSALKPLAISPQHAKWRSENPVEQTDAMAVGVLTERLLFVPDDLRCEQKRDFQKERAAWQEQKERAKSDGITLLTASGWQNATGAAEAVRGNNRAQELLAGCEFGQPCHWQVGDQERKALFDAVNTTAHRIVDLKTTSATMTADGIARQIAAYRYDIQAAWYSQGYAAVHGVAPEFWFLFVESSAPHAVVAVQLDADWIAHATDEMETMAAVWQQCADAGVWPGPAEMMADSGKLTLSRPTWAPTYTVGE